MTLWHVDNIWEQKVKTEVLSVVYLYGRFLPYGWLLGQLCGFQ